MKETRWDTIELIPPARSYSEIIGPLDFQESVVPSSYNALASYDGTVGCRWGSSEIQGSITGKIVRLWSYETLPSTTYSPPHSKVYLLASVLDGSVYKMYVKYMPTGVEAPVAWSLLGGSAPGLRDINGSKKAHLVTFSKGLAYIKSFPDSGGDKYGTCVYDGSNLRPWGLPGPTVPARISGETIRLTAAVTAAATTFNTTTNTPMPATPYDLWIGYEKVTVTAEPTSTSLTVTRGAGGTTADAHDEDEVLIYRDWSASDHKVDVQIGWKYAFAYVSVTGQVSNRSDVEYNPDLMPSNTGPFYDLIPKVKLTLDSFFYNDTTTYPYLNMYRTTDGGGTFYFLEQVANPGTSTYTYSDDSFGTGSSSTTYNDPVPDTKLDTARYAPSLTSNTVPTTVPPPLVIGTDTPAKDCWAMVTFSGRIWIGIGNYLFFSSREETRDGIGEECFPSGNLGNFFILDCGITGMAATEEALYVGTSRDIWKLTGTSLDTFSIVKKFADIGVFPADNSMCSYRGNVAFVDGTGQPTTIQDDQIVPIGKSILSLPVFLSDKNIYCGYMRSPQYEWLVFFAGNYDEATPGTTSSLYIYDIKLSEKFRTDFWQTPWLLTGQTCAIVNYASGDTIRSSSLVGASYNSSAAKSSPLLFQPAATTDTYMQNGGTTTTRAINMIYFYNRMRHPAGNHLNVLNVPVKDTNFYGVYVYHTSAAPGVTIYQDNVATALTAPTSVNTPRVPYGTTDYTTSFYPYNQEVQNIKPSFTFSSAGSKIAGVAFVFDAKANP